MEANDTLDWEKFEQKVKEPRGKYCSELSPLLFRGQGKSKWKLETTLERNGAEHMLFRKYYQLICASMGPEVEAFADIDVPTFNPDQCKPFLDNPSLLFDIGDVFPMPVYRYMAYLRHLGFPSPLLDWSRSPFVAAFFAFRDNLNGDDAATRSIFVYCGKPVGMTTATYGQRKSARSGPMFRHTRGISVSAAITQFVAAMRGTMGGDLIRTKPFSIGSRLDRTICGNSTSLQVNGRRS